jgi:hypothetical protein
MSYQPSLGLTSNKSLAVTGKPDGFRTYYADPTSGIQRQFLNIAEALAWFDTPAKRVGQFDIVINTGGTLAFGVITGGINNVFYFKDGIQDSDLKLKAGEVVLQLSQTLYTPIVISTFGATYSYVMPIPTLIIRETISTGVYKYRWDIQPVYDSVADTLTIDFNNTAVGDLTIKK